MIQAEWRANPRAGATELRCFRRRNRLWFASIVIRCGPRKTTVGRLLHAPRKLALREDYEQTLGEMGGPVSRVKEM